MKQVIPFHKEILFKTMIGEITSISLEHTLKSTDDHHIEGDFIVSGSYKMTEASQLEEKFSYKIPLDITIDERYDMKSCKIDIDDFYYEIVNEEILKVNIDVLLEGLEEIKKEPVAVLLDEERTEQELIETIDDKSNEEGLIAIQPEDENLKEVREGTKQDFQTEKPIDFASNSSVDQDSFENVEAILKEEKETIKNNETETDLINTSNMNVKDKDTTNTSLKEKNVEQESVSSNNLGSIFSAFRDTEETFQSYSVYIVRENDTLDSILDRYQITKEELTNYNNLDNFTLGSKLVIPCPKKDE